MARICSSSTGSSSSMTTSFFTPAANSRIIDLGSGWLMPSFRTEAFGNTSCT